MDRDASNQEMVMTSRGKTKTTMAKLNREARLRERRVEKQARKDRRRDAADAEPERDDSAPIDGIALIEDIALPDAAADASASRS
jgi:hypothetical protein